MPYIEDIKRRRDLTLSFLIAPRDPGELNYAITSLLINYVKDRGQSYRSLSEAISAAECAKLEFYRREVAPYENKKILENGDVY